MSMTENEAKAKLERTSVLWESATNTEMVEAVKVAIKTLEEIQQYRAIGTVEEFKALKEKSTPKKPIYSDFDENEAGDIIPYKAVCPICGHEFEFGTWNDEENHHCDCGQKLDWEGEQI